MKKLSLAVALAVAGVAVAQGSLLINGAGATFPFPLYSKWFSEYNKLFPNLRFNYQSIGSGGGIKQITEKTVDFGASDAPLSNEEMAKAPGLLNLPTVLGAVVVAYNLPGVPALNLSGPTLAGIFLGTITNWNDAAIAKDNAGVKLPDMAIAVASRSDGSGTNYVFTDYLAKVSPAFKAKVGVGKSVKWPVGMGGKGNEGVTGVVKSTPGALGYVELAYANQNKLSMASIQNADGAFVKPTIEATSAAAAAVAVPEDFRVSITNAPGKTAYPISSFTYLLVYQDQVNKEKGPAIIHFLKWAVTDGEKFAAALDYAPLPEAVQRKVLAKIAGLTVMGAKVSGGK
ncbi:MAG: phosphate ABC transporter substrate-binding protein PstS [Myxococcaceae bacterium]